MVKDDLLPNYLSSSLVFSRHWAASTKLLVLEMMARLVTVSLWTLQGVTRLVRGRPERTADQISKPDSGKTARREDMATPHPTPLAQAGNT